MYETRPLVTFCSHIASLLFSLRSKTCTLPSTVHAANAVDDHGVQATSPTWWLRSNDMRQCFRVCSHILTVQSAEHDRKSFGLKLFQRT